MARATKAEAAEVDLSEFSAVRKQGRPCQVCLFTSEQLAKLHAAFAAGHRYAVMHRVATEKWGHKLKNLSRQMIQKHFERGHHEL